MAHGDCALMEIFDAERIAEGLRELFKFEHLARVGLLMDAVQSVDAASEEVVRHGAIGGEHELLDDAVRDVALQLDDAVNERLRTRRFRFGVLP